MTDTSHLVALHQNLSAEKARLAAATAEGDIALRTVWVAQLEREIAAERAFLGLTADEPVDMSDDELLAELEA
jgi:hypothetical protein